MEPKLFEKRPGYWIVFYRMPGSDERQVGLRQYGVADELDALVEQRRALKDFRAGIDPYPESVLFAQALEEYLEAISPPTNEALTVADKKQRVGYVLRWLTTRWPHLAKVSALRSEHVEAYRDARKREVSAVTVNKDLTYFAHWHKWCRRKKYATVNIFVDFEWLPEQTKRKEKHRADFAALMLQNAEPNFRPALAYAYQTGARLTEIERTTLGCIDLERRVVVYEKTKRGSHSEKSFHASAYLVQHFSAVVLLSYVFGRITGKPATAADPVFLNARGWAVNLKTLRNSYLRTAEDAGLVDLDEKRRVIVKGTLPKLRATRHTFGSALLANRNVTPQGRRGAMDHSNYLQIDTYATADNPELRAAFETMDVDGLLDNHLTTAETKVVNIENRRRK